MTPKGASSRMCTSWTGRDGGNGVWEGMATRHRPRGAEEAEWYIESTFSASLGIALSPGQGRPHLFIWRPQRQVLYHPQVAGKGTDAERGSVVCPREHSSCVAIGLQDGPCPSPPGILTSSVTCNGLTVHPESLLCIQFSHQGPHLTFPAPPDPHPEIPEVFLAVTAWRPGL